MKQVATTLLLFTFLSVIFPESFEVKAQGEKNTIQLSGLIVDGDSAYGVPGVHIYIPRAGIGTTSNPVGFFSLPTLVGIRL